MGTTLTGTTPQDTYDSLIKVTDNGPLSGTAKYLSDGLGNDSALALSTSRVGIGTSSPNYSLQVNSSTTTTRLQITNSTTGTSSANGLQFIQDGNDTTISLKPSGFMSFETANNERLRITSAGNVGIGTSSPAQRLDISNGAINFERITTGALTCTDSQGLIYSIINNIGSIDGLRYASRSHRFVSHANALYATIDVDGLKFGSDTAAANALDDYEEGTWTPSLGGNTTYSVQAGTYTKIGRQVVVNFAVGVTTIGTGSASDISGLPFTSGNVSRGGGGVAFVQNPSTAYASINPIVSVSSSTITFVTSTILGAWADQSNVFANGTIISGTITYFV